MRFRGPATGSALAKGALEALRAAPPGGAGLWRRTNHRGDDLTLLEGPAFVVAAAGAALLAPGVPGRTRAAAALAVLGAGAFGAVDDLRETGDRKGLRGHLIELAHGRVTTGGLKVLGIGATGLVAAALQDGGGPGREPGRTGGRGWVGRRGRARVGGRAGGGLAGVVVGGALVAASANLVNLFDLRPGRALKVVLASSAALGAGGGPAVRGLSGAAAGPAAALLPDDLAETSMLGDTGANAAGALLGVIALERLGPRGRVALLAAVTGLTLASERVSFTRVIESTPVLRELDGLGRRPR